jgi:hypothetical protein
VHALIQHARTALWPERRAALASFRRGVASSDPKDLGAFVKAVGPGVPAGADAAEAVFRAVLTAYLDRLAETEVSNPDQAYLYSQSLDEAHVDLAAAWLAQPPEYDVLGQ